jgi:hypothetical protein
MGPWTQDEFLRAAVTTRINPRTLDACRDVLVEGLGTSAAAEKHKMFAAQVSRALTTLREKHAASMEVHAGRENDAELQVRLATYVGKAVMGDRFESVPAEVGRSYEGPVVGQTAAFLVQRVGQQGVLHDLAKLASVPALHSDVTIAYPENGERATCVPIQRAEKKSAEVDR